MTIAGRPGFDVFAEAVGVRHSQGERQVVGWLEGKAEVKGDLAGVPLGVTRTQRVEPDGTARNPEDHAGVNVGVGEGDDSYVGACGLHSGHGEVASAGVGAGQPGLCVPLADHDICEARPVQRRARIRARRKPHAPSGPADPPSELIGRTG